MAEHGVTTGTVVNASKDKKGPKEAVALVREQKKLVAAKGKKVVTLDLAKDAPSDADIMELVMGPTGNLRAPAWTRNGTFVVGFDPDSYARLLG